MALNKQARDYRIIEPGGAIEEYVFETPILLPANEWELEVEKGHAWIFSNKGDFIVNDGESVTLHPADGDLTIKRLYVREVLKFKAIRTT